MVVVWRTYTPNASQTVPTAALENNNIETMADTVSCSSNSSNSSADNGDFGALEGLITGRRVRREGFADDPLEDLVEEEEGMKQGVLDF